MQKMKREYNLLFDYSFRSANEIDENHSVWKIHGRTNKPVDYYGNKEIHDFKGLITAERISLDLEHCLDKVVGYADNIEVVDNELIMDGHVFRDLESGETVYKMLKNGVPLQASVTFSVEQKEDVKKGKSAFVNGKTVFGPITIYRRWKLESIAICRYGADDSTFVSQFHRGEEMPTKTEFSDAENSEEKKEKLNDVPEKDTPETSDETSSDDLATKVAALEETVGKLAETVAGLVQNANEQLSAADQPGQTEDKPEKKEEEDGKNEMSRKIDCLSNKIDKALNAFSTALGAEPEQTELKKMYSSPFDELADIERSKL